MTTEQIHSSRYRRADNPLAYKNYLTRANAILDRVPLIDGYSTKQNKRLCLLKFYLLLQAQWLALDTAQLF